MPNYGYHLARAEGRATRAIYRAWLKTIASRPFPKGDSLSFDVVTYSGEKDLPELVASIRSFLRYVGRPNRLVIVSDGTLSACSIELLEKIDETISVSDLAQWVPRNLPERVYPYLISHPTGKQLAVLMSLPAGRPVFYMDSDVLFFPGAADLIKVAGKRDTPAIYLADCRLSADERLFRSAAEKIEPINTGVLFLFEPLDWSAALDRFLELQGEPTFFTNQTMVHLTLHANGAVALDPRKYVLQLDDQFVYPDRYLNSGLALRHYVNPVRHKFWGAMARRAFS